MNVEKTVIQLYNTISILQESMKLFEMVTKHGDAKFRIELADIIMSVKILDIQYMI